ncbi:MAG: cupin domain-containing protein [Rhodothermaceae bacterium]
MLEELIKRFNLQKHPEGGYFSEVYRSEEKINKEALPERYGSDRNFGTSIYFLIDGENVSNFHRLKSDEFWYFHCGSTIEVHIIYPDGKYEIKVMGLNFTKDEVPSLLLPKGCWFGARLTDTSGFGFVSCAVFPGFDFSDFELAKRDELTALYPQHSKIISDLTSEG